MNAFLQVPEEVVRYAESIGVDPEELAQWVLDDRAKEAAGILREQHTEKAVAVPKWVRGIRPGLN